MADLLTGALIVASPMISEGLFARSVCLIVHQDPQRTVGILLNRPLKQPLPELWQSLTGSAVLPHAAAVHFGGPISGPVVALHQQSQLAEMQNQHGVYLAAQRDHLQQLMGTDPDQIRIIVGHSDWQPGQLETEIAAGLWYVLPATTKNVFEADEIMWPALVRRGADARLAQWVGAIQPGQASWN